jgi:hypothetical protein
MNGGFRRPVDQRFDQFDALPDFRSSGVATGHPCGQRGGVQLTPVPVGYRLAVGSIV